LQVVANAEQPDLVTALPQCVGDLIFHFRLIGLPGSDLPVHLALVVGVIPAGIWSVKNDCNSHR
jgi:hypothetical protein